MWVLSHIGECPYRPYFSISNAEESGPFKENSVGGKFGEGTRKFGSVLRWLLKHVPFFNEEASVLYKLNRSGSQSTFQHIWGRV